MASGEGVVLQLPAAPAPPPAPPAGRPGRPGPPWPAAGPGPGSAGGSTCSSRAWTAASSRRVSSGVRSGVGPGRSGAPARPPGRPGRPRRRRRSSSRSRAAASSWSRFRARDRAAEQPNRSAGLGGEGVDKVQQVGPAVVPPGLPVVEGPPHGLWPGGRPPRPPDSGRGSPGPDSASSSGPESAHRVRMASRWRPGRSPPGLRASADAGRPSG